MTTSSRRGLPARIGVAALGVGMLTAVGAGAAIAAPVDEGTVDVSVEIAPDVEPGSLALTVAADSASLTEGEAEGTERVFTGTLPTVTVTDTRVAEDVDPDFYWYVMGTITDFSGDADQADIPSAQSFGWYPAIVSGNEEEQLVAEGPDAPAGDEENPYDDQELLVSNDRSAATAGGSYAANAALELRTPNTVAPGEYAATMTLSLFEDDLTPVDPAD